MILSHWTAMQVTHLLCMYNIIMMITIVITIPCMHAGLQELRLTTSADMACIYPNLITRTIFVCMHVQDDSKG